ncbi:unnamed protein product, partial [Rangifer tarandus platyrhynchus]
MSEGTVPWLAKPAHLPLPAQAPRCRTSEVLLLLQNRDGEAHQQVHPNIPSPPERSTEPMDTKGSYQPCSKGTLTVVE